MATQDAKTMNQTAQLLIDTNNSLLERFVALLEKLEKRLLDQATQNALQGELEELLRMIIQIASNSIEAVLTLQSNLQESIVKSFFPKA